MIPEYDALQDKHLKYFIRKRSKDLRKMEQLKQQKKQEIQRAMQEMRMQHTKWREWIYAGSNQQEILALSSPTSQMTTSVKRLRSVSPKRKWIQRKSNTKLQKIKKSQKKGHSTKGVSPQKKRKRKKRSKSLEKASTATLPSFIQKVRNAQFIYRDYKKRHLPDLHPKNAKSPVGNGNISPGTSLQAHERIIKQQKDRIAQLTEEYQGILADSKENKAIIEKMISSAAKTPTRDILNPFAVLDDGTPDPTQYNKKRVFKNKDYERFKKMAQMKRQESETQSLLFKKY